jgi:hypothetical protein
MRNNNDNNNNNDNYDYENNGNDDLDVYIYNIFESDGNDISDLSTIVEMINEKIVDNSNDHSLSIGEKIQQHRYLMKKRMFTRKLLKSKARAGHDFYYQNGPSKRYEGEQPYWFHNVELCKEHYNYFIKEVWNPSVENIENIENIQNIQNIQNY